VQLGASPTYRSLGHLEVIVVDFALRVPRFLGGAHSGTDVALRAR
jgi:hypothetical protein